MVRTQTQKFKMLNFIKSIYKHFIKSKLNNLWLYNWRLIITLKKQSGLMKYRSHHEIFLHSNAILTWNKASQIQSNKLHNTEEDWFVPQEKPRQFYHLAKVLIQRCVSHLLIMLGKPKQLCHLRHPRYSLLNCTILWETLLS